MDGRHLYLVVEAGQRNGPDLLAGDQLDRETAGRMAVHDRLQLVPGAFQEFKLPHPASLFLRGLDELCRLDEQPVGRGFVGCLDRKGQPAKCAQRQKKRPSRPRSCNHEATAPIFTRRLPRHRPPGLTRRGVRPSRDSTRGHPRGRTRLPGKRLRRRCTPVKP